MQPEPKKESLHKDEETGQLPSRQSRVSQAGSEGAGVERPSRQRITWNGGAQGGGTHGGGMFGAMGDVMSSTAAMTSAGMRKMVSMARKPLEVFVPPPPEPPTALNFGGK